MSSQDRHHAAEQYRHQQAQQLMDAVVPIEGDEEEQPSLSRIPLSGIKDGGAQMRIEIRPETITDYADDMAEGATFPPVVLFHDGTDYWLADGFHRVAAARKIERDSITAEVRQGTSRDAILHGVGANACHGLRRTQADKRRAVERLLNDAEWAQWSDRKIAKTAGVDHKTVAKVRRELAGEIPTQVSRRRENPAPSGEIPSSSGKPSLLGDVLRNVSNEMLIAECKRRGLTMEAADA